MRGESLYSAAVLNVALFDPEKVMDRSQYENCDREFSTVKMLYESDVHRSLRDANIGAQSLLLKGADFAPYESLKGFHLLFLPFQRGGVKYLRTVNFLGRYVSTVVLDIEKPDCGQLFAAQRLVQVDSHPPFADLDVDGRPAGEAPRWLWLRDGAYTLECALPGEVFKPQRFRMPTQENVICGRENTQAKAAVTEDEKMTAEEKGGAVMVYLVGIAGTLAAIVLPILFLF